MSAIEREKTLEAPALAEQAAPYETCEQCEAPVDASQRYCVVCGTRRRHVYDPAAGFLAKATSRSRGGVRPAGGPDRPRRRSAGLGLVLVIAAIPLAAAVGVLIGGRGNDTNSQLLAALRAQKPTVVNVNGGGGVASGATAASTTAAGATTAGTATPVARLTSSFGLQQGYAVQLQTLPGRGTTAASVAAAERRARARGANAVGLIIQAEFHITPAPPPGDYVIYSGQYHSNAQASAALAKLRGAFPAAKVIAVRSASSAGAGPALSTTSYGTAHQVSGFKPTTSQLATGSKVVNKVSKEINGNYVKSQQGLPDAISVP